MLGGGKLIEVFKMVKKIFSIRSTGLYVKRFKKALFLWLAFLYVSISWSEEIGWYYGQNLDPSEWQYLDILVVQPTHVSKSQIDQLHQYGIKVLAYVSVGEVSRNLADQFPKSAHLSDNPAWSSIRLDIRNKAVREYIVNSVRNWMSEGYDGVFLDTVDSYTVAPPSLRRDLENSMADLVLKIRHVLGKTKKLWMNRGFEILDHVGGSVDGIAVESLFAGYDATNDQYVTISKVSRQWLIENIKKAQRQGLEVVAIEYLPENALEKGRAVARKVIALGIQPWITDGHLTRRGISRHVPLARKILGIYDTSTKHDDLEFSDLHMYAALPIEYMGYYFDYRYVDDGLVNESWTGRYAGIVIWLSNTDPSDKKLKSLCRWAWRKRQEGLNLVMMGTIPDDPFCYQALGIKVAESLPFWPVTIVKGDKSVGHFEGSIKVNKIETRPFELTDNENSQPWVILKDSKGNRYVQVATTRYGGFSVGAYTLQWVPNPFDMQQPEQYYWVYDPYKFFREALNLKRIPVVDVTTENGRRVLTSHIDGDGFVSRSEFGQQYLAAQVIRDDILNRYPIPHTVSIIEGEIAPYGAYPNMSLLAEPLARSIFKLPFVEAASHTFSHPFVWRYLEGRHDLEENPYGWNMKIPGYTPSLKREIIGSIEYINHRLLPKDKKVKVFLWSGDALPGDRALAMVERLGMRNMNGGNTRIVKPVSASITNVSPIARIRPSGIQIYAPVMNENVFTNDWTGPYWGYRDVINTFKFLESPKRLKPIGIYYHFYSGSKLASLNALKAVYEWALDQDVTPMYASMYIDRARSFYDVSWYEKLNGQLCLRSTYPIRTLRTERQVWLAGDRVLGWRQKGDVRYTHLLSEAGKEICLEKRVYQPQDVYLISSNMVFMRGKVEKSGHDLNLRVDALKGLKEGEMIFQARMCRVYPYRKEKVKVISRGKGKVVLKFLSGQYELNGVHIACQ